MLEIRKFIGNEPHKRCPKCGKYLPMNSKFFWKSSASIDGFYGYCKKCNIEKRKEYYKKYPKKDFNYNFQRLYGINYEKYLEMEKEQKYRCAICGLTLKEVPYNSRWKTPNRHFSIDHDHETGKIRGLLCGRCNSGLGYFLQNPFILFNAIKYLKTNKNVKI